jgi:hypothetical protein
MSIADTQYPYRVLLTLLSCINTFGAKKYAYRYVYPGRCSRVCGLFKSIGQCREIQVPMTDT